MEKVRMAAARTPQRSRSEPEDDAISPTGRSLWTGQLRLALVSIPVQLVAAVKSGARIAFHQVDAKSHKRIRYEKVAPGIGPVDPQNIVKGFEVTKGQYVLLTDEELDQVKLEAQHTINLIQFVDHSEIDPIYFDKPYFVLPDGKLAYEAYAVLRDALRGMGKMGIGQLVMRGREYIVALEPRGQGLMLETLRFADEVKAAAPFFANIGNPAADEELLDLAKELIRRKSAKFDPTRFHDHYTEALRKLIEAKKQHVPIDEATGEETPQRGNVVDLVTALRQSVRENQAPEPRRRQAAKRPHAR
jgi:DNA end-binding protein Ku